MHENISPSPWDPSQQDPSQKAPALLTELFDRTQAAETFATPEARREFILGLSNETFPQWLIGINGAVRGMDHAPGEMDGTEVEVASLMPPETEDKQPLLERTLEAAKTILEQGTDVDTSLEDVSLLVSGAINYIHPFNDGNGRTSRIAGLLIAEGYDGNAEALARLEAVSKSGNEGRKVFQNSPVSITKWLNHAVALNHKPDNAAQWPLQIQADVVAGEALDEAALQHLDKTGRIAAQKIMRDPDFGQLAATKIMIERDLMPDGTEVQEYGDKNFAWVEPDKYFAKFTDADIEATLQESRAMRYDRILTFIRAMAEPESFPIDLSQVEPGSRATNLRDYYAERVREHSSVYTDRQA